MAFYRTYELNVAAIGRKPTVTYRIRNSELELTVSFPDSSAAIQTLQMSEDPDVVYRGFANSVVGVARVFVSRYDVRDELTKTYQQFLAEYKASQSQQSSEQPSE